MPGQSIAASANPDVPETVESNSKRILRVPVGAIVLATCGGLLAGGLTAKSLHDAYPAVALLLACPIAAGLYALVRAAVAGTTNPSRGVAAVACATGFAMLYFLALAGESYRPPRSPDALVRLGQGLLFIARMLGAAALALAVAGAAAWRASGGLRRQSRPGALAPLVVASSLGIAAFVVAMILLMAPLAVLPRAAAIYGMLAVIFLLPPVSHGVWTYAYGRILSRWELDAMPAPLVAGLADLRSRCRFQFDRVVCLDGAYGNGRIAAVTSSPRSTTLIISEPLATMLEPAELLAILAHEAAHVELNHVRRKLLFGLAATAAAVTACVGLSVVLGPVVRGNLQLARVLMTGALFSVGRGMYDAFVTRRHEREADAYAANAAGASTLLRALERLGAGQGGTTIANRWTTHSTWAIRSQRLREMARRET